MKFGYLKGNSIFSHKKLKKITKKWQNYEISNFEYIMILNKFSGRNFLDITQYPVFPWILSYFNEDLNLENIDHYRDLSKSMGSLVITISKIIYN